MKNGIILFFRYVWALYFLVVFVVLFLLFYPVLLILLSREEWYRHAHQLRRIWGYVVMTCIGIYRKTTYDEKLSKDQVYIFTPNHFSYLDIITTAVQMPYSFGFMAKMELAKIPLFKIFFRTIDIPVDRFSKIGAAAAYELAKEKITKKNTSILMFPEGGIGPQYPKMRSFKLGAFKLAIQHKIPIVPITIGDNWKRLPSGGADSGGSPGISRMHIHRPIPTTNLKPGDEQKLADDVYAIIEAKLIEFQKV